MLWYQGKRVPDGSRQSGVQSNSAGYTSVVSRSSKPCS